MPVDRQGIQEEEERQEKERVLLEERQEYSIFFYVYVGLLIVQLIAVSTIMLGTAKFGGRIFLAVFGVALPNISLAAFFGFVFDPSKTNGKKLCVDEKIALTNFLVLALVLGPVQVLFYLLHVLTHGSASGLQPSEVFGDSGTSYTFVLLSMLTSSGLLLWAAADVISVYCLCGGRPAQIVL
jgi:hypothetical protein